MPDEPVDGFSDVQNQQQQQGQSGQSNPHDEIPGPADPGIENRLEPLSADERAELEQEIREGDQEGHHGHVPNKQ